MPPKTRIFNQADKSGWSSRIIGLVDKHFVAGDTLYILMPAN